MSGMVEHTGQTSQAGVAPAQSSVAPTASRVRASSFKYYIHDSIGVLRLKPIGELVQADIAELNGCWRTAKTTLGKRKLVLDLESLRTVDEAGKQWLASMSAEGAYYVPENYLVTCIAAQHAAQSEVPAVPAKQGVWKKLIALLRGERVSARQAQ
jgi:hypothetical protein